MLWRINDKINVKCLSQCLAHDTYLVNVGNDFFTISILLGFLCFLQSDKKNNEWLQQIAYILDPLSFILQSTYIAKEL